MDRINQILQNETYRQYVAHNGECEKDRVFCKHDMSHFMDVARIAMILNEKDQYGLDKEIIYAAALLHDIGRWQQYETGEDHALASAKLAPFILSECGFQQEADEIVNAISVHRKTEYKNSPGLKGLLYRADKLSRPCYVCSQEKNCNWKKEKKNITLQW